MVSNSSPEERKNSHDNVFEGLHVGAAEPSLVAGYLAGQDFSGHTRKAIRNDLRKFARWFSESNREPFTAKRVTLRDVTDFRSHLHREKRQAVASVNRALVVIRRFFDWLVRSGHIEANPAKQVRELRCQPLAPKGLERADVRRLLREIELRADVRANAIFSLLLYSGCRVSDLVNLELPDLLIGERNGSVNFRHGKGNKQRTVPLPLPARRALQVYLETRPQIESNSVFVGERGPITDCGVRALCRNFSALIGVRLHPHLFRHSMAKRFLADNNNDLVSLAQILGHESLNTTSRYSQRSGEQLAEGVERLSY
jgi:site-specific recombinase XerD